MSSGHFGAVGAGFRAGRRGRSPRGKSEITKALGSGWPVSNGYGLLVAGAIAGGWLAPALFVVMVCGLSLFVVGLGHLLLLCPRAFLGD